MKRLAWCTSGPIRVTASRSWNESEHHDIVLYVCCLWKSIWSGLRHC